MKDISIQTVEDFLKAYANGQRTFYELEFESGENLTNIIFDNSNFINCWFCADFSNSSFKNCKFIDCNLKTSDFSNADLSKSIFENCSVDSTIFVGAKTDNFAFKNNSAFGVTIDQNNFKEMFQT
jgi:uncharacterized protein YjbI with pentapeptide repeats